MRAKPDRVIPRFFLEKSSHRHRIKRAWGLMRRSTVSILGTLLGEVSIP